MVEIPGVENTEQQKREYFKRYMKIYFEKHPEKKELNASRVNKNYWVKKAKLYNENVDVTTMDYKQIKAFVQLERQKHGKLKNG
jgi:hypothetical protein